LPAPAVRTTDDCFAAAADQFTYSRRVDLQLVNKVALVTGGASGIGSAVVQLLASEGARVAVVDRDASAGKALASEVRSRQQPCEFFLADLSREEECRRCVDLAMEAFGGIDVLVNNAGGNDRVGLDQPPGDFAGSLQRNLMHFFAVTHFAADALKRSRGAIVNVTSKVAVTGQGHTSGYAAAKGGVNALTREWAAALAPHGVRVNAVAPAECDTPGYRRWFEAQPNPAAARRAVEESVPLGRRMTTPEELAAAIVFLASPRSSHTTGQIVYVDGGYTHLDRGLTTFARPQQ
jgi:L-fucose dehydrogenase